MTAPYALTVDAKGLGQAAPPERCIVVIFGAKGDLTRRELLPSLYELARENLLPRDFALVGFSRGDWDDDGFRAAMREAVRSECDFDEAAWRKFAACLSFIPGDITSPVEGDYARLRARLAALSGDGKAPDNVLFHLAVPPDHFGTIIERLGAAGLARSDRGWRRLVIEKPFGQDRETALALDRGMREVFAEEQIYRIDHFLGKETVQNMLVVRFANPSFEPIWNRNYIDHVEITVAEDIGIGTRAGFYESTGVVRDMVQNHLLQLLCMVAIEPPVRFDGDALRDETVKVLRSVQPIDAARDVVLGQYGPGTVDGKPLAGYRQEANVAGGSVTATYAALRLELNNWRWAGVPFYLRTGKRLARQVTEIAIQFKPTPHLMFPVQGGAAARQPAGLPAATRRRHHPDVFRQATRPGDLDQPRALDVFVRQRVRHRDAAQGLCLAAAGRDARRPDDVRALRLDLRCLVDRGSHQPVLGCASARRFSELCRRHLRSGRCG